MPAMSQTMRGNEENVPVITRNPLCPKQGHNLPPNVSGTSRGFLDLSLDRVQWNVSSYPGVAARVIWWGESYAEAASIK